MLLPSVRHIRSFCLTMSVLLSMLTKCAFNEVLLPTESSADDLNDDKCPPGACDQCFPDSVLTLDGDCVCDLSRCDNGTSVVCDDDTVKNIVREGVGVPGDCCDVYQCIESPELDCNNAVCPVDTEECPEDSYKLPARKSVNECCSKPQGCQCLPRPPCNTVDCPVGFVSVMIQKASNKPGKCCPLYSCRNPETEVAVELPHDEPVSEPHPGGCITADGKVVENDSETWMEDPCTTCSCQKGRKICQASMCLVSCTKPVYITGECCPSCDASSIQAIPAYCSPLSNCSLHCIHGFVQDSAGCLTCQCQQEECVLECPDGFATDEHGSKLCKCTEPSPCTSLGSCLKVCSHGYKTDDRGCKICECHTCKSTIVNCTKHCTFGYSRDDKNCTVCTCLPPPASSLNKSAELTTVASEKTCELDGRLMDNGELVLNRCSGYYCYNGNLFLSTYYCSQPTCFSTMPVTENELCCPYCEGDSLKNMLNVMTCQSQNGTRFKQHDEYTFDGCIQCVCYDNVGYCAKPQCPPTACLSPLPPKSGECCPSCPRTDDSVTIVRISQTSIKCETGNYNGYTWRASNCSSCYCYRNRTICYEEFCHKIKTTDNENDIQYELMDNSKEMVMKTIGICKRYLKIGNDSCCKTCVGEAKFSPIEDDCIFSNRTYTIGFKWMQHDTCEYCQCSAGGTVYCSRVKCTLPCFTTDREHGKCCCTGVIQEFGYIIILLVAICLGIIVARCIMKQWRLKRQMRIRDFTNGSTASQKCEYKYIPASPTYEIPLSKKLPHNGKKCPITDVYT